MPNIQLGQPRTLPELVSTLRPILLALTDEVRKLGTPPEVKDASDLQLQGMLVRDLGTPSEPTDAVRLQDLQALEARLKKQITAGDSTTLNQSSAFALTVAPVTGLSNLRAPLAFTESPNGSRVLFTPSESLLEDANGNPICVLVKGQSVIPYSTATSPPPVGYWRWTGTQIEVNQADAPEADTYFTLAVAALA